MCKKSRYHHYVYLNALLDVCSFKASICIDHFSCCEQIANKKQLKGKGIYFGSWFRVHAMLVGKVQWQEGLTAMAVAV